MMKRSLRPSPVHRIGLVPAGLATVAVTYGLARYGFASTCRSCGRSSA
jgi:hypothetical protein